MRIITPSLPITSAPLELSDPSTSTGNSEGTATPGSSSDAPSTEAPQPSASSGIARLLWNLNPLNHLMKHGPAVVTDVVITAQNLVWDGVNDLFSDPTPVWEALVAVTGVDSPSISAGLEYNAAWGERDQLATNWNK